VAGPLGIARNPQLAHRGFWRDAPGGGVMPGYPLRTFHAFPETEGPKLDGPGALPLAGVRVLDFTIFWAGPSATRTLADLGAEVIWVERPNARMGADIVAGAPASPAALQFHLYDTKMFRGPRELARLNSGLIYVSLSGWGADGPWADWRSYGPSIEAASSIEGRTGYLGGEPLRLGHTMPDGVGGLVGALAALRGLRQRMATGTGGWFDISQLEAYVAMSAEGIIAATRDDREGERIGNRSASPGVIQGVFRCAGDDAWIAIRLDGDADNERFAGFSGIAVDALADIERAEQVIAAFARPWDKSALAEALQAQGLEAFPVLDALELTADPHLRQRGYFRHVQAGERDCQIPGTPLVASPRMADAGGHPPRPGEHSAEIRAELAAQAGSG
jgi:crotonobetainyl-CoA:carnitine CoA-transferase CaiB-like acyl-CoA transferase